LACFGLWSSALLAPLIDFRISGSTNWGLQRQGGLSLRVVAVSSRTTVCKYGGRGEHATRAPRSPSCHSSTWFSDLQPGQYLQFLNIRNINRLVPMTRGQGLRGLSAHLFRNRGRILSPFDATKPYLSFLLPPALRHLAATESPRKSSPPANHSPENLRTALTE